MPLSLTIALLLAPADPPPVAAVRPLFNTYCTRCHDADKQEGGLDFTAILADEDSARDRPKLWRRALERVSKGAMPPSDSEQPTPAHRAELLRWLSARAEPPRDSEAKQGPGEPNTVPLPAEAPAFVPPPCRRVRIGTWRSARRRDCRCGLWAWRAEWDRTR